MVTASFGRNFAPSFVGLDNDVILCHVINSKLSSILNEASLQASK